ncbi:hypothetical protein FRB90_007814 [Tulasnella sp. 427]|nr:hypothetical protein FRB90_007814 [Tulasnella sp. 427]
MSTSDLFDVIWRHENDGIPIIIGDLHHGRWDRDLLSPEWLLQNLPETRITVRNVSTREDVEMTFREYIEYARNATPDVEQDNQRLYGKDAPCPPQWAEWLGPGVVPQRTLPLNRDDIFWHLHPDERPETLMTYLGIGGTYTPCHKDPCASQGQNLMTYAEPDAFSVWFFTPSHEAFKVARHFKETYQTELDWEATFLTPSEFAHFPCPVYVCKQTLGDLVLVPRRSCHQVVNFGGLNIKTSWSRMIPISLVEAITDECPIYRRVCRPEVYRTKLLLYRSLEEFTGYVNKNQDLTDSQSAVTTATDAVRRLLPYLDQLLVSEWDPDHSSFARYSGAHIPVCNFCGADIFQSFFECQKCTDQSDDDDLGAYQICATCYVEGRSCKCIIMEPMQRWDFADLLTVRNRAAALFVSADPWHLLFVAGLTTLGRTVFSKRLSNFGGAVSKGSQTPTLECDALTYLGTPMMSNGMGRFTALGATEVCVIDIASTPGAPTPRTPSSTAEIKHISRKGAPNSLTSPPTEKDSYLAVFGRPQTQTQEPPRSLEPSLRLTWAAIEFPDCHPIDVGRSKLGFYDEEFYGLEDVDVAVKNGLSSISRSAHATPVKVRTENEFGSRSLVVDGAPVRVGPPKKRRRRNSSPEEPLSHSVWSQGARSPVRSDPSSSYQDMEVSSFRSSNSHHINGESASAGRGHRLSAAGPELDEDHDPLALSSPPNSRKELDDEMMSSQPHPASRDGRVRGAYVHVLEDLVDIRALIPEEKWISLRDRMSALGRLIGAEANVETQSPTMSDRKQNDSRFTPD